MCVRKCLGQEAKLSGDDCEPSYCREKRINLLLEGFLETRYLYSAFKIDYRNHVLLFLHLYYE